VKAIANFKPIERPLLGSGAGRCQRDKASTSLPHFCLEAI